ncbi:hypothetical protein KAFR_0E01620 [Kazachstania africana CBS 2517]|uniref:Nucleoporin n=1 Tax=Kazachstania africana (strain ATCC 22294 / BCRC 22015 / CBS 2517 / CECT 1963 / NBRC 1671 / NRRL Y-8276) TaxID=1071382 RepID=H2AVB6_KAZAF|nr:hypothetical protein KAFR_0E01620 [Kazachstania africana CBS 2517]CCF58316.1 hypothetical protein KAFR_0E01620 [Kazachstania africana CBS 2517]
MALNWSTIPFEALYKSIEEGKLDETLFQDLISDLQNLNLNSGKLKNPSSRSELEKGEIKLDDGTTYKFNQEFIITAIKLSDELNLDELVVAQLILSDPSDTESSNIQHKDGISLINHGKVQYYLRRQYILQIVAYIVNCSSNDGEIYTKLTDKSILVSNVLPAFKSIHIQLDELKQLVNKAQILDNYDILFQQNIKFKRDFLLREYDILSQILYGLVAKQSLTKTDEILKVFDHVSEMDSNDFFIVYYLPAIFHAFANLEMFSIVDVRSLHSHFLKELDNESLYSKPVKVAIIFVFLTFFISWCKAEPSTRAKSLDFKTTVDIPMTTAVEQGAIEQLLVFAADTSLVEKDKSMQLFYDIRSLLERHIPRLIPKQLLDNEIDYTNSAINNSSTNRNMMINTRIGGAAVTPNASMGIESQSQYQYHSISLSEQSMDFFLSTFHFVLQTIIADCAFLLTKIKDAEEDSLLSGEDFDLDDISVRADLERFFLTIYFFYASRPNYSSEFWQDKESNAYGFIEWSAKCNDSLMRSCFYLMISSLSFGSSNSLNVFHYFGDNSTVSWNIISQCISDYAVKINNLGVAILQKQQIQESEVDAITVALEEGLNEETIIFLSSLLTLVGSVAYDVEQEIKVSLCNTFSGILFEFAKLDTPLIGAVFKTLSNLVPTSTQLKNKFWNSLDCLIFKSFTLTNSNDSYRAAFSSILVNFPEVLGFLQLFNNLIKSENRDFGTLSFPTSLGQGYRKVGIWPYFDYILNEIFVQSFKLENRSNKTAVLSSVLQSIEMAITSFDYSVILNSIPAGADLDALVVTENFFTYVQESPAVAVFNYLFQEEIYQGIFSIVAIGIDHLATELENGNQQMELIQSSVNIINRILQCQETYIEELVPIVRNHRNHSSFIPKNFGLHGLRSFHDAILFNVSVVAHLALYVGVSDYTLATESLNILKRLSLKYDGGSSQYSIDNKLLTIFDSVDESARIKDSFISQIESFIDSNENLTLKIEILDFINRNITYADKNINVAHLLLGFHVSNVISIGPRLSTFINSDKSLLSSIISILEGSLETLDNNNIDYAPMRLASIAIEIILKLSHNQLTSSILFEYLSSKGLFERIMNLDPQINKFTLWNGVAFNPDDESFIMSEPIGALLSFFSYRNYLIQYLSLSIHKLSFSGTEAEVLSYVRYLISNTMYSARIFSFLDTLNFENIVVDNTLLDGLSIFSNLQMNLDNVTLSSNCSGIIFELEEIKSLMDLFGKAQKHTSANTTSLQMVTNDKIKRLKDESAVVIYCITGHLSSKKLAELQLAILHSWVQLIQIIVSDGKLSPLERSAFILEVFSTITPKMNDYVECNLNFSEELVSLSVFLYEIYQKDRLNIDDRNGIDSRLYNLFKVCIHGISSPLSSISLRADFYVLANQYLVRILKDEALSKEILQNLRINNEKVIEIISNDAIFGQGTSRITAILLMDTLIQIANLNNHNFILELLMKSGQLSLFIRSLKNTDILLDSANECISIDDLMFELTAFKATIFLLFRISETTAGAQALVQNRLLEIIGECSFLKVDPDLGLNITFKPSTFDTSGPMKANISLDSPLFLDNGARTISLIDLMVPIFQLVCAVLVSVGSKNSNVINKVKKLLQTFRKLIIGIFKRDELISAEMDATKTINKENIQDMVKVVVILCSLTGYQGEEGFPVF